MAAESTDSLLRNHLGPRRKATPPRSIFDNYQSAYQTILSSDSLASRISKIAEVERSLDAASHVSFTQHKYGRAFPVSNHSRHRDEIRQPIPATAYSGTQIPQRLSSRKTRPRSALSRPVNVTSRSNRVPKLQVTKNGTSVLIERSSAARNGPADCFNIGNSESHARYKIGRNTAAAQEAENRGYHEGGKRWSDTDGQNTTESIDSERDTPKPSVARTEFSPAGQAPNVPLPRDPSYTAVQGTSVGNLSETSSHEDTGRLLNLTRSFQAPGQTGNAIVQSRKDSVGSRESCLESEFSWMGNDGLNTFRDLSFRELKQLRTLSDQVSSNNADATGDTQLEDMVQDDQPRHKDVIWQSEIDGRTSYLNGSKSANLRDCERLWKGLAPRTAQDRSVKMVESSSDDEDEQFEEGSCVVHEGQSGSNLSFLGLQNSSTQALSIEGEDRVGPIRLELDVDAIPPGSSISGDGGGHQDLRSSYLAGKDEIDPGSSEDVAGVYDDSLYPQEYDDEEWETMGPSWMRYDVGTEPSVGRDTTGSSLANLSSNESVDDDGDRGAAPSWDPLSSCSVAITPPPRALISEQFRYSFGPDPATVPRYIHPQSNHNLDPMLSRSFSSTPALAFPSSPPRCELRRGRSRLYRHPTPLCRQYPHPFSASPPPPLHTRRSESCVIGSGKDINKKRGVRQTNRAQSIQDPFTDAGSSSGRSEDGSYANLCSANSTPGENSALNTASLHTKKSSNAFTEESDHRTRAWVTGSPHGT
jgi:hypothetical protein